ncbi:MAG: radical SAM protein [Candidatus Omnitrophica bacterium]|nr:radical SAM protein [Candidatus Omnitrophota bacterium]MDD5429485.1 radical SAM protein [Candidatus Omnitrophota bacterium]
MVCVAAKRKRFRVIIPAYPAFNIYTQVAKITTALGPVSVASVVNKTEGWDAEVIDENNLRRYGPRADNRGADHEFLQSIRPADVVGLYGGLTSTIPRLYEIARFYKQKGVVTIAGGQHFVEETILEALNSGIDYIVIGEGEVTIRELLKVLDNEGDISSIEGIVYLKNGKPVFTSPREPLEDFENLPLPDFSLVRYASIKLYPVGRIRGCGMNCEFCTVKGKPRCASPERLLEQISFALETKDARHFFIVDDLFGQQREETLRFCAMLKKYQEDTGRRLDVTAQIRLDKAKDSELLSAMRLAGINTVAIGFESPIDEELQAMNKHISSQEMVSLSRIYHKFGFLIHGMFIFGYPLKEVAAVKLSSEDRIKRFRSFIKKAQIDTIQVLLPGPLPGTELRRRLQEQGRVYPAKDIGWEYYDGNFPLFEPDQPMTAEQMQTSARKIMGKFYQFKYLFMTGLHVFSFPVIIFYLHNIKQGWRKWYRSWRNALARFGGWVILNGWTKEFKKGIFWKKLQKAQQHLKK